MTRLKDITRKTVIFLNEFEHWLFGNWITDIGKLKIACRFFFPHLPMENKMACKVLCVFHLTRLSNRELLLFSSSSVSRNHSFLIVSLPVALYNKNLTFTLGIVHQQTSQAAVPIDTTDFVQTIT